MENILIADDHEIVRSGIRMMMEGFPQKYHFIEASTCEDVIKIMSSQPVNYAILDMSLADGSVFSVIDLIAEHSRQTNILVYSMNAEKIYARRLIEKGVRGFVSKLASMEELENAIKLFLKGETYLSRELKNSLLQSPGKDLSTNPIDTLSNRELEVVEYLATGMGPKEIGQKLNIDITTVSTFRRRAFEKLDVRNVVELKEKFLLYKSKE
jgi:DNA-binding NarL/FixJ family response regulator